MRRIPTLLEVGRRHILNTLHLRGSNRGLTAKVLGLSTRGSRIKLPHCEGAGFAIPDALARDEDCGDANVARPLQSQERAEHETATVNVIEELISLIEAIGDRAQPSDPSGGQMIRRKEKI